MSFVQNIHGNNFLLKLNFTTDNQAIVFISVKITQINLADKMILYYICVEITQYEIHHTKYQKKISEKRKDKVFIFLGTHG